MISSDVQLYLTVTEADADDERLYDLTQHLMRELRESGAESVARAPGEVAPEGTKAGHSLAPDTLDMVADPASLLGILETVEAWSQRAESRRVKIVTPAGLILEFTPEKPLSPAELLSLVERLTASQQAVDASLEQERLKPGYRTRLRQLLSTHFNKGELRTLCFDLDVEYDDLPGEGTADKARELVRYLERHSRINDLLEVGKQLRPDVPWE